MSVDLIFWTLVFITVIQLAAVLVISGSIKALLNSDLFKQKMLKKAQKDASNGGGTALVALIILAGSLLAPEIAFGQEEVASGYSPEFFQPTMTMVYVLAAINAALFGVLLYFRRLMKMLVEIDEDKKEQEIQSQQEPKKQSKLMQVLTDAVPVEEEASVLTDHEYDGIQELDNNLPPWWKWGFYFSIFVGVIYLLNYHVFQISPLQIEAYEQDVKSENEKVAQYLKDQALNVDEFTVTAMADSKDLAKGQKTFVTYCRSCHMEKGQGAVGPNLTDDYWIHGGDIQSIFKTIKYGANNGMQSWQKDLNPVQIQQVASYIMTLDYVAPPEGLAPQGELMKEEANEQAVEDGDSSEEAIEESQEAISADE